MMEIPKLGLGTSGRTGEAGMAAIVKALEVGYRHIDTAQSYGSEAGVGEAVRRSGVPRSEVFITTKVADTRLDKSLFMDSVERSLETIGLGPVDLLLIHWPVKDAAVPFEDYMLALAEAQRRGHTRLIGVSNFPIALLERTEQAARAGQDRDEPGGDPSIFAGAEPCRSCATQGLDAHGLPSAQPWGRSVGSGVPAHWRKARRAGFGGRARLPDGGRPVVIPASASEANLRANWRARDVKLDDDDLQAIRVLNRGERLINPEKSPAWDD